METVGANGGNDAIGNGNTSTVITDDEDDEDGIPGSGSCMALFTDPDSVGDERGLLFSLFSWWVVPFIIVVRLGLGVGDITKESESEDDESDKANDSSSS